MNAPGNKDSALATRLRNLEKRQQTIVQLLSERRDSKDTWDKLAAITPLIATLLISVIGGLFGFAYTAMLDAQKRDTQRIEVIGQLIPHLKGDRETRELALLAISRLCDPNVAVDVVSICPQAQSRPMLESLVSNDLKPEARITLANCFNKKGVEEISNRADEAELCFVRAKELHATQDTPYLVILTNLSDAYSRQGKHVRAISTLTDAREILKRLPPDFNTEINIRYKLANEYSFVGKHTESIQTFEELKQWDETNFGPNAATTVATVASLGQEYTLANRMQEAENTLKDAVARLPQMTSPDICGVWVPAKLGDFYERQGKLREAAASYKLGAEYRDKARLAGQPGPADVQVLRSYLYVLQRIGDDDEAAKINDKLRSLTQT